MKSQLFTKRIQTNDRLRFARFWHFGEKIRLLSNKFSVYHTTIHNFPIQQNFLLTSKVF